MFVLTVVLLATGVIGVGSPSLLRAETRTTLGLYGGHVLAAPLWLNVEAEEFAGLKFVDMNVPYSTVVFDSGPSVTATGAWLDTGPLGATVVGTAAGEGAPVSQPQYAVASYPGSQTQASASVADQADPLGQGRLQVGKADAKAAEKEAQASAVVLGFASEGPAASASTSTSSSLRGQAGARSIARQAFAALVSAVNRVRTRAGLAPFQAAESEPTFQISKLQAASRMLVEGRTVKVSCESIIEGISLGGGAVQIRAVKSSVAAQNDGTKGTAAPKLEVLEASLGGVPIQITPEGVSIQGNALPAGPGDAAPAADALNQALAQAGWSIRYLGVEQAGEGDAVTGMVRGIELRWIPPVPEGSGVPNVTFGMVFGRAEAVAHARLATVVTEEIPSAVVEGEILPQEEPWAQPGYSGAPASSSSAGAVSGPAVPTTTSVAASKKLAVATRRSRGDLVALFGLWQLSALVLMTALVKSRMAAGRVR
ncbi:MAG: hypothetical protein WDA71_09165 [Actinomycetota bacterium]